MQQFSGGVLIRFWVLLIIASTLLAPAPAESVGRSSLLTELGYTKVSLRRTGENHLFIFGWVENRKRSCLIDTGWSFTTVSTNTAGELVDPNRLRHLRLGSIELTNVPVAMRDMRVNNQPASYQVVLGCDFLLRHQALIDCDQDALYLQSDESRRENSAKLEALLKQSGWAEIKLKRQSPAALTCEASVENQTAELLVDSGAMWSCLDKEFASKAGLRAVPSPNRLRGPATDRQRAYAVTTLKSWRLGAEPMPEKNVAVLDLAAWGLGPNGHLFPNVTGILGGAELKSTEALIDCGSLKLWVRKATR